MKKNKFISFLFILSFLLPLHLLAQQEIDITGLWKGSLYDDTTKQYIPYEFAISDDNGKLSGYSYAIFQGEKGEEIGLKTIKIKRKDGKIIIEDVDLIANTYSIVPTKKVKKTIVLTLDVKDSTMIMSGKWATNWTKEYHPVTGTIEVKRKNDLWKDEPLMKKLDTMKLASKLSFNPPSKKEENVVANVTPKETTIAPPNTPDVVAVEKLRKKEKKPAPIVSTSSDSSSVAVVSKPAKKEKKAEVVVAKEKMPEIKKSEPIVVVPPPAAEAAKRKTQTIQSIFYKTDSLVFTLYDNGIVDGDTVSILMNKELIFSKQGLSEKAVSKTVYMKDAADSILLTLYAENLGSIPPNTGLLIIYDGKKRYEIFFSADLQNNAAIVLRRKKDE